MAFTNLLELAAEADRQSIAEVAEKNPWLKTYAEMGERFEKLQPRVKTLYDDGDVEKVVNELERWRKWNQTDWPVHQSNSQRALDLLAMAQAKVHDLESRSDIEMTPDEVRAIVKESVQTTLAEAGVVDNRKLEASLTDLIEKQLKPQLESNVNGLTSRFEEVYSAMTPEAIRHAKEFDGEALDMKALFKHMRDTGQMDPTKAYKDWIAPRLAEKKEKDWETKVVEAEKRGEQAGARKAVAATGRSNPVDGKGSVGSRPVGPIERMRLDRFGSQPQLKEGEKAPEPALGKGVIAMRASQAHAEKMAAAAAN